jgi:hypothetical protein
MVETCFDFDRFKKWYKEKNAKDFGANFDSEEPAPYEHGIYFTQSSKTIYLVTLQSKTVYRSRIRSGR